MSQKYQGKGYYAKIKYSEDGVKCTISVKGVLEFGKVEPRTAKKNLNSLTLYSVTWKDKNGDSIVLPVQISAIEKDSVLSIYLDKYSLCVGFLQKLLGYCAKPILPFTE